MSPTKVENNRRKCNGFAPLFSGLLQIQISLKQSSKTRDKRLENKLCFLQIELDVFVIQFKPTYSL